VIVWTREAAPKELTTIQCPHVIDGFRCTGSVQARLPPDAQALAQLEPPGR
jgi:hypothetical protein